MGNPRIWLLQRTQDIGSLCLVFALALAALSTTAKAQSLTKNPGLNEIGNVAPVAQPSQGAAVSGAAIQSQLNAIQSQLNSIANQQGLGGVAPPGNVAPVPQAGQVGGVGAASMNSQLNQINTANQMMGNILGGVGLQGNVLGGVGVQGNVAPVPQAGQVGGVGAASMNAQLNQINTANQMMGNILGGVGLQGNVLGGVGVQGNVAPVPQAGQVGGVGAASMSQLNQINTANQMMGNILGGVGLQGNVLPVPQAGQGTAVSGVGTTQSQLNAIQSQINGIISQMGAMGAGGVGAVPQQNPGAAASLAAIQNQLNSIANRQGLGGVGPLGNVAPVPQAGQVGGVNASMNSQLNINTANQMMGNVLGGVGLQGNVFGGVGVQGNVGPVPQNAGVDAAMNAQINQNRNVANQMFGNVLGGGAFNGAINPSPINLNPSAPAFGGTLLNPPAPAPQASASDPGSLAVNTAVNIYVAVAGAAGITIPPGAVPVIQDLANCAMSGMTGNACANNVVISAVLRELGVASLTPVANCLAGGGQPSACINPAALPSSVQPLANCILGGGNAGICAENATVVQALPKGAQQVMQTAMSTFSTVQVGSSSMQQPPGLANIVSIAGGIKSGDWGTVVAGVGSQNAGIAAQAVASSGLPPNVAGALGPILAAMAEGNAFQAGFSAFSKGDAVGMAEAAFQWYANQYLQAPCQAMPSGGFKDTVCGGAAAAINAVADVGGDIAKDILGIGKDILQFLGLWNAVDDVASGIWDGVTSVISDIGSLFGGKKVTVECVGWSTPSQYFGNVMASCMPNLASASGANGQAPDTSSVYNACVSYYDSCPAYNKQAVAANCQKVAGTLGTAAQNASNTLNAAAASYTTLGAGTFVANVYSDPTQRKYDNFCSGNFWPVERQQYAKQCAAALSKYFPSYAAAPSSNACPVQTASSAMQQACLNAIDSSSSKTLFAGSSSSLYCQEQQASDKIIPFGMSGATGSNWPCQAGNNAPPTFVVAPLDLATAVPVMNATWQQPNKRKSNTTIGINIGIAANNAGCTPQSTAFKPAGGTPFRSVVFGGFGSTGGVFNPGDGFGGPTIGGMASAIASAVAGVVAGLPPAQTGDSGSLSGTKGKLGTLKTPPSGGDSMMPAQKKQGTLKTPPSGDDSTMPAQKKSGGPKQAATGVGNGGTNGVSSSSAMDNAAAAAMGGGLTSVAGTGGGFGTANPGRLPKGGFTPVSVQKPPGVQAKNPPAPTGGGNGGTNGTVSQGGAGKPSGGVASTSKPTTSTSKPASGATMPMTDYGGCAACAPPPPPPEVIK